MKDEHDFSKSEPGGFYRRASKPNQPNYTYKFSWFAGAWFAAASLILIGAIAFVVFQPRFEGPRGNNFPDLQFFYDNFVLALLFIALPFLCACFGGILYGSDILDLNRVETARKATICGLKASLTAWVAFIPLFSALVAFYMGFFDRSKQEGFFVAIIKSFFAMLFYTSLVGSIAFGWLILIIGAVAGWLLFRSQNRRLRDTLAKNGKQQL